MAHVFLLKAHPLPFSPCSHNSYWLVTYTDNNIHWTKTRSWSIIKLHYTLTSKHIPFPFLESRVPSGLRSATISPTKNQMTLKKNQRSISSQWNKTKQVISSMDCVCVIPVSGGSLEADRWSSIHWNRKHWIILIWIPIITFFFFWMPVQTWG